MQQKASRNTAPLSPPAVSVLLAMPQFPGSGCFFGDQTSLKHCPPASWFYSKTPLAVQYPVLLAPGFYSSTQLTCQAPLLQLSQLSVREGSRFRKGRETSSGSLSIPEHRWVGLCSHPCIARPSLEQNMSAKSVMKPRKRTH